jgi:hypothetical protein
VNSGRRLSIAIVLLALGAGRAAAHHTSAAHAEGGKAPAAKATTARPPIAAIAGRWRGQSLCVNLKAAPACKDEQVIYDFAPVAGVPDSGTLNADKLVDGKPQSMGPIPVRWDAASRQWQSEFHAPNGQHVQWTFAVRGDSLVGSLVDLTSRTRIREVWTTRIH